mgnify:FL=1
MPNYAQWSQGSASWAGSLFSPQLDEITFARVFGDSSAIRTLQVSIDVFESTSLDILVSVDGGVTFSTLISTPSQGVQTANISLPIGEHSLVFKASDDTNETIAYSVIVSRFVILGTGQSNMVGWSLDSSFPSLVPSPSGYKAWLFGNDYVKKTMRAKWDSGVGQVDQVSLDEKEGDSWMIRFANLILAEYDEPAIFIPSARGGRLVSEFQKDNTSLVVDGLNLYASTIKRVNEIGGATINFYQQGENDAVDHTATPASAYKADLNQFANDIKADLGIDTLIIPLHTMTTGNHQGDGVTTGQVPIRQAQIDAASENENIFISPPTTGIDVSGGDGLHFLTDSELSAVAQIAKTGYESYLASAINQLPTANAGADQSVEAGATFTLDGSASIDTDGTIAEYRWTQTQGDTVTLDLTDPVRPVGVAPSTANAQTLAFSLVTVDDDGVESVADTVDIDVAAEVQNDVLSIIDKISFTFESDGMITAFPGRANRETFRLKPSDPTGLVLDEGWFDFEANDVKRVEISILETTGVKIISSDTDSITIEKGKLHARMGDMPIKSTTKEFEPTVSVFVGADDRGVVMTAPGLSGAPKVKYYATTARVI